ncbi:MAG: hypothetical protein HOY71_37040, partial [Nonomuraea sp.]|nr:hypothetical protein [Nonomuraea sp.]
MTAVQQRATAPHRGRQEPRGRSAGTILLNTAIGLVLVAGAVAVQTLAVTPDAMGKPLTYTGARGEAVDAGRFSVRVQNVSTAKQVSVLGKTVPTDRLFLIIELQAMVDKTPLRLDLPSLLTGDGRRFAATDKISKEKTLAGIPIQPGWWTSGAFVFEVPADALTGARFVVGPQNGALYSEPLTPEAQVDL